MTTESEARRARLGDTAVQAAREDGDAAPDLSSAELTALAVLLRDATPKVPDQVA